MTLLATFVVLVFAFSLLSRRLELTVVTGPIVFTTAGLVVASLAPGEATSVSNSKLFLHLAEVGLVLLLFSDAAHTDLSVLWDIRKLPARLLAFGKRRYWLPSSRQPTRASGK
jgi:Kef-type K+ transport system membrane component KefB